MTNLEIDCSLWRTGDEGDNATGKGVTALLNEEGYMCCLGFLCLAIGVPPEEIIHIGEPEDIEKDVIEDNTSFIQIFDKNSIWVREAISINDDSLTTFKEKQWKIIDHFKKINIDVNFINE